MIIKGVCSDKTYDNFSGTCRERLRKTTTSISHDEFVNEQYSLKFTAEHPRFVQQVTLNSKYAVVQTP
jgi:hypothetical protein